MVIAAPTLESLTGRRGVDIGTSFTRAWNERTGKTTKRSKDYPNPEYYSLRYNFKPESIDNEGAGTLTPKPGGGHIFELERPSSQNGDSHRFTAVEQPSKEWECVLLWDPATQQLTLEKLDATLNLNYEGRGRGNNRAASPTPSAAQSSRTKRTTESHAQAAAHDKELEDELEAALTGYSDAEGEPDDDMDIQAEIEAIACVSMNREEEEEEEEEEMERVDVEPPPPPPPPLPSKSKAQPKPPQKTASKAKPKGRTRTSASAKREVDDFEEEELTFGEPTRRTTRLSRRTATTYSTTTNSTGLALPTAPVQNRHAPPTPSDLLQPPSATCITYAGSDSGSDSDESDDGGQEGSEVLDAAALERELEQVLAADGEGGMEDEEGSLENSLRQNGHHDSGRPLSLNELFGEQSQDDDSSSDDSDDD